MPYKPAKRKTCELIHWTIAILLILCVLGAIAAIVFGVLVAKPGIAALDFKNATCIVKSFGYRTTIPCDCSGLRSDDPYCRSEYPCIQIMVGYEPRKDVIHFNESENFFQNLVMIRESETDFSGIKSRCSFHHCHPDFSQNKLLVEEFRKKYGKPNSYYPCQYNVNNKEQVVTSLRFKTIDVLLSLIIPSSIFLLCLIIVVTICVIRCRQTAKRKAKHPVPNPFAGPRNYMGRDMPAFEPDETVDNMNKLPDPFAQINDMLSENGEAKQSNNVEMEKSETEDSGDVQLSDIVPQRAQMSTAM
ncbi:uncharacterized protein LOC120342730 [Styela clava]|uniref:uncharacterized protein LOC120342730 n=1 Tax=Styela clava TaxID=7725 RepID=UPI00193A89D9|nr:uncharacterized protein LOC120342730 [Styela clava]